MPARSSASHASPAAAAAADRWPAPRAGRCRRTPGRIRGVVQEAALADVALARARPGPGRRARRASQPRSAGNSAIASPPSATSSPRSSGGRTPPGKRQLIADDRDRLAGASPAASAPPSASDAPQPTVGTTDGAPSADGVGWSKSSVAGSRSPVAAPGGCAARPRSASRSRVAEWSMRCDNSGLRLGGRARPLFLATHDLCEELLLLALLVRQRQEALP